MVAKGIDSMVLNTGNGSLQFLLMGIYFQLDCLRQTIRKELNGIYTLYKRRNMNPQLEKVERLLAQDPKSPPGGEVMIRFDSGYVDEFHTHDTVVDDTKGFIRKDATDGTIWYDGDKIESVWVHKQTVPSE